MGSSRYIECGVVDLSTDADSSYRLADFDLSPSRPSAGNHPPPLAFSAGWLRKVGTPVWKGSACRQGQGRHADMCPPGLPTRAYRSADITPPGTPTLPSSTGGSSLRPARRNPPPYMARLSALLDETLRPTCIKVRRRVVRSKAESCLGYGGESGRGGRRTVRTRSECLSDLMRGHPTPLAISVDRLGRLGRPTGDTSVDRLGLFGRPSQRLRWTDRGTSVNRHGQLGLPTLPTARRAVNTCQGLDQYHGILGPIPRYGRVNKTVSVLPSLPAY